MTMHLNAISKVYMEKVAAKPDFLDLDGDGNKKEPMKKAAKEVEPPKEKLKTDRDMFNIPKGEQESARERLLRKAREKRAKMSEALDPVGKEDADIDNDGDVDNSDKYLHKKRKAIGKAMGKDEECEKCGKKKCECDDKEEMDEAYWSLATRKVEPGKPDAEHKAAVETAAAKASKGKKTRNETPRRATSKFTPSSPEQAKADKKAWSDYWNPDKKVDEIYMVTAPKKTDKKKAVKTTIDKYGNRVKVKESKNVHGEIEVPSGDIKKLVAKAVKRIDTDVDGDVEHNDKHKGEYGEFVPTPDGKGKVFTGPKIKMESFSNWREDLTEVMGKDDRDEKVTEKKVNNVVKTSAMGSGIKLGEAIEEIGGTLLEQNEVEYTEPVDIFEDVTNAEMYFLDEDFIYNIVEESILELLDEGYDIDHIVDSIVESVDNSLQVLEEDVAATAARKRAGDTRRAELRTRSKTMRPDPAAMRRNQRMNAVKDAAKRVGSAVKSAAKGAVKGTAYGAAYAAGAAVRGARALASKAREGYKRGVEGSGSSSDSSGRYRNVGVGRRETVGSSSSSSDKPGILRRVGSALKSGIKGAVRAGARVVRSGANALAKGAKSVEKRMSEDYQINAVSEYFIEEGLNEEGVAILIEELGVAEFVEFVYDLGEEIMITEELNEARAGGVKVAPVTKTGKSVGSLKGGPRTSAIKRLRKEKAARREAEAKASAAKPSGMKAALQSQSKTAAKRDAAVSKAKNAQPKKKGILDRVAGEVLKGIERHNKAMAAARETGKTISKAARVGAKGASEFGKGFSSGVKTTAKVTKGAKKVLSNEEVEQLSEKSVSVSQQQAAGAALAAKRGEKDPSELKGASLQMYKSMSEKELRDFAKTKHDGLPEKKEVNEQGVYGRRIRRPITEPKAGIDYGGYEGEDDSTRTLGGKFQTKAKPKPKTKVNEEEVTNPSKQTLSAMQRVLAAKRKDLQNQMKDAK